LEKFQNSNLILIYICYSIEKYKSIKESEELQRQKDLEPKVPEGMKLLTDDERQSLISDLER